MLAHTRVCAGSAVVCVSWRRTLRRTAAGSGAKFRRVRRAGVVFYFIVLLFLLCFIVVGCDWLFRAVMAHWGDFHAGMIPLYFLSAWDFGVINWYVFLNANTLLFFFLFSTFFF